MNKKNIQMILLLLLLGGGGALYFFQQSGGGLDISMVTSLIDDFLGEKTEAPPPSAPAPKRRAAKAGDAGGAGEPGRASKVSIPDHPAQGQIQGKPFVVDQAKLEDGVLSLRQGNSAVGEQEIVIFLFSNKKGHVPGGETFKVEPGAKGGQVPHVHVAWQDGGKQQRDAVTSDYTMEVRFGKQKELKLPGRIYLTLPDATKTQVAGTFEAEIKGFRLVGGKPDLTSDSLDTLQYLALYDVLKDDPDKPLKDYYVRDTRYTDPGVPGKPMTGYLELEYRVGDAKQPTIERYQFVKEKGEWRVLRKLKPNQIDQAHPIDVPDGKEAPARVLTYLAAKRLEADLQKQKSKTGAFGAQFSSRYSDKHKLGVCEVSYRPSPEGDPVKLAYLFRLKPKGWALDRQLAKNEKVDFDSGKIARR